MKIFLLLGFIISTLLLSNDSLLSGFFKKTDFGKPFVSEIYTTANKLEIGYDRNYDEYNIQENASKFDRPVVAVDLGIDIPLYSYGFGGKISGKYKWQWALTLPVSIHILEDMFESITAPLLDTDYNFGGPKFNIIRRFEGNGFIKNIALTWLPYYHQCTHLGDEIIIYRKRINLPITRVNISYYFTDLNISINDPDGMRENLNSFKLGLYYRVSDHGYGWFSIREGIESDTNIPIEHSKYRAEYYFDYRNQRVTGFLASKKSINILSLDVRRRVRLNYPTFKKDGDNWITKDIKENHVWSFNLYFGWKFYTDLTDNRAVGVFFRAYNGLNPFGQMRNNPNYRFVGISFTYDL